MKKITLISTFLRIVSILIILNTLLVISIKAIIPDPAEQQWQNVNSADVGIVFYSSSIGVMASVTGISGSTMTNGTIVIEKVTGEDSGIVGEWHNLSSSNDDFSFFDTVNSSPSAGRYKVVLNITVTCNGVSERINISSSKLYT